MSLFTGALRLWLLLTLLTGALYPLLTTLLAQGLFPEQANGSLLTRDGKVTGSALIAQPFEQAGYFWSRPSAILYNGAGSGGSNLGPLNPQLASDLAGRVKALASEHHNQPIPVELVTTSASGLDPHLSPAALYFQVARVARARQWDEADLRRLIDQQIESAPPGVPAQPVVNVLRLNLALDALTQHQTRQQER